MLASIYWDPDPVAFTIPIVGHPIVWYSLFFALGTFLAYMIVSKLLGKPKKFLDSLIWYCFIGMLVGARLGHVFFYELDYYLYNPLKILFTWEGGLASHGGALGILIALIFFWKRHKNDIPGLQFRQLLDLICIAVAAAAGCIRIGNFFNQEILGTVSNLPWAVFFGHPADANAVQPCHPVQLYEALFYFVLALGFYLIYTRVHLAFGKVSGLFFIGLFSFRFAIEFLKLGQASTDGPGLFMGQLLSLPFIVLGIALLFSRAKVYEA